MLFAFTDEALANISATLPSTAPPERVALLPKLLHAWAREDLREHLFREGRAVTRCRRKQLTAVGKTARSLLQTMQVLDESGRFQIACGPEMRQEARIGNARWIRRRLPFLGPDDIEEAERRRDEALSWLSDLIEAIDEPGPAPPPAIKTRGYLIVLDLAAIF